MLVETRLFQTRIDIQDGITFCIDIDGNLLKQIKLLYERKCFEGCYIVNILSITNRSPCMIDDQRQNSMSFINCEFNAEYKKYRKNDIIPIAPVSTIVSTIETHVGELIVVLKEDQINENMKMGQYIAIKLEEVIHLQSNEKVNAVGTLYKPVDILTYTEFNVAENILNEMIKIELDDLTKLDEKDNNDFINIFFRSNQIIDDKIKQLSTKKSETNNQDNEMNDNINELNNILIYIPLTGTLKLIKGYKVNCENPMIFTNETINDIKRQQKIYKNLLIENIEFWKNKDIKSQDNIWKLYELS